MVFKVRGISRTISSKLTDKEAKGDTENLVSASARRFGSRASERAPVDTGLLSSTMISGLHKDYNSSAEYPKWDLLQRTEYTKKQEFEHSSKSGFIRNSAIEEKPKFKQDLERRFKKRGKRV